MFDDFVSVMEIDDYRPVLDIRIAKILNKQLIIAVTDSSFYQFIGDYSIKATFSEY